MAITKKHAGQHRIDAGGTVHTFELFTSKRKTLTMRVRSDGMLTIDAPTGLALKRVYEFVRSRSTWIARQQAKIHARAAEHPPRQYVTGEVWHYLGRSHPLRVEQASRDGVTLSGGEIVVSARSTSRVPRLLRTWFKAQAVEIFAASMQTLVPKVIALGITPPDTLTVREMSSKWGSCSAKGRVTLNLKLVQLPLELIDYVIAHELCHLRELNHSAKYYALLETVVPDWKEKRRRLHGYPVTF